MASARSPPAPSPASSSDGTFTILDFCNEVLHNIFRETDAIDLARLSQTCRALKDHIDPNPTLWRSVYLRCFDTPLDKIVEDNGGTGFWRSALIEYTRLQRILEAETRKVKDDAFLEASQTITSLLSRAKPASKDDVLNGSRSKEHALNENFLIDNFTTNQTNLDLFLFSSSLYKKCGSSQNWPALTAASRQASAKLHCLFGTSQDLANRTKTELAHPYARSRVYDLRRYNDANQWGPFTDDGSFTTDWEKVEAIMVVLGHDIDAFRHRCAAGLCGFNNIWEKPFDGVSPNSFISAKREKGMSKYVPTLMDLETFHHHTSFAPMGSPAASSAGLIPQPELSLDAKDPYNVTGTWNRVVAFLDYTDFYNFNFGRDRREQPLSVERAPIDTQEAVRFIMIKWRVVAVEEPGPDDHQDYPVVKFKGFSRSMHSAWDPNANSRIVGSVRVTREGEVRWTTLSIFHGEARWRSEGIQVGGIRSKRGVIGTWFDKDLDQHGPAGPTAFWKVSDELEDEPKPHPLPELFQ